MVEVDISTGLAHGEQSLADHDWAAASETFDALLAIRKDPAARDGLGQQRPDQQVLAHACRGHDFPAA